MIRRCITLLLGLTVASAALAQGVAPDRLGMNYRIDGSMGGGGKSMVSLTMKDGSQQTVEIRDYPLVRDSAFLCMRHDKKPEFKDVCEKQRKDSGAERLDAKVTRILVRQARNEYVSDEDAELIRALAADDEIYAKNQQLVQPVCVMPNAEGQVISTSFMPACTQLSKAETDAAPHAEADDAVYTKFSVGDSPTVYRFKIAKKQREKLIRENTGLLVKWSKKA